MRFAGNRGVTASLTVALVALVLAVAGAAAMQMADRPDRRQPVDRLTRQRGPTGVAAAYGHPLGCLTVTILPTDRTYARADFDHRTLCGRYTGYPTAIFHYASGRWRAALDAVSYRCPVVSLPVAVQTALDVCQSASTAR